MNTHYTYFLILAASLAGPLALSFDKKVAFYRKWKWLFPAMLVPALFYIAWDVWFTHNAVWSFNAAYITGQKLINLPIEEVLFFFVVPYCCVFIYECIRCYFPRMKDGRTWMRALQIMAAVLFVFALVNTTRSYTFYTFLFCSLFIGMVTGSKRLSRFLHAKAFLVSYAIILVPFLLVNGFLTAIPVVIYNNNENLGLRIYTIPFEDVFYGMLLVWMNLLLFEWLRQRRKSA